MASAESMSLEETNKIRIGLGLAPLAGEDGEDGGSVNLSDDPDALAEANWAEKRNAEKAARSEKEAKERLARAKNQRELRAKLHGKGLGEADDGGDDGAATATSAAAWVKQSRKRAKEREKELEKLRQRERELEERDREAIYDEQDLAGLKVAHGVDDFEQGADVILTLTDRKVLDDEDDELQNVNLAEYARTAERVDLKKKGKTAYQYTGYDDDEFDPSGSSGRPGKARGVLSKYDQVIGEDSLKGSGGEGFRLGGALPPPVAGPSRITNGNNLDYRDVKRDLISLDYTTTEQNDYLQEGEVGFKAKKKKSKKAAKSSSRRTAALDDDEADGALAQNGSMDADMANSDFPSTSTAERRLAREAANANSESFDDDELQSALARQRRQATRNRIQQIRGEDIARQVLEERVASMPVDEVEAGVDGLPAVKKEEDEEDANDDQAGGGMILNDTSEFVRNIAAGSAITKREVGTATPVALSSKKLTNGAQKFNKVKAEPIDDDATIDQLITSIKAEDREEGEAIDGEEDLEEGMDVDGSTKPSRFINGKAQSPPAGAGAEDLSAFGGTAAEQLVSGGLASTLSLLKQSGLVKTLTPEERERERAYHERERFIAEARIREQEREADRARSKAAGASKTDQQREYENKQRAFEYAQKTDDAFRDYKPNVDIKYRDEFGRDMTPKEAWKDLSHKFHGKGSGTNKRAKLLKRVEDERKREAMASGDTPLAASAAFNARQERMGSATMVIGVGNKNAAPTADQLLGTVGSSSGVQLNKNRKAEAASGSNKRKKAEPKVLG